MLEIVIIVIRIAYVGLHPNQKRKRGAIFSFEISSSTGGKRVCNSLAGSYKSRTAIADVQHNTDGHSGSKYHEFAFGEVPQPLLKLENERKRKLNKNTIANQSKPKKMRFTKSTAKTKPTRTLYGPGREDTDFTPHAYEVAKKRFLEKLHDDQLNRGTIEVDTRGQNYNSRWPVIRKNLLTPSYFGRILNVNSRKSYTKIVEEIIYKNEKFANTADTRHQKMFELEGLQVFYDLYGLESVTECGIFIDTEFAFLGASPFRLYGDDSIITIKCPKVAYRKSVEETISKKLIPFWKISKTDRKINKKSHWYIEIQGQLRITGRKYAYLVIYLGEGVYEVVEIERNDEFWKVSMEKELIFFYTEAMLKELVNPRGGERGMSLRKYNSTTETFE